MDPALEEVLASSRRGETLEALVLLNEGHDLPDVAQEVARFGRVVTCRVVCDRLRELHAHPSVASVKASRVYEPLPFAFAPGCGPLADPPRRDPALTETGRGVVVAALDWGCDFAHPNFRRPDGGSRLLALWDQRADAPEQQDPSYGRVHTRPAIDAALASSDPYRALGYAPGRGRGLGAHGTHALDIAAGNGALRGSLAGVAPEADLVFVHLSARAPKGLGDLGDSVRLLEGLDFVRRTAGSRPWVCNMSLGRTGGAHSGRSLVERAVDQVVSEAPGRAVVQSVGNYYGRNTHAEGWLPPGGAVELPWIIDPEDVTGNELEVWYAAEDRFGVELRSPDGLRFVAPADGRTSIALEGHEVGRLYHRRDPLHRDHHVDIYLRAGAPAGRWTLTLTGEDIADGRFHAWIERDIARPGAQSRFPSEVASPRYTTGTIANGLRGIAVGAYDPRSGRLAPFSSSGPTRDGRRKPDLVAPGTAVCAARSSDGSGPGVSRMSGTSMAAPHVAGTVALMFEAAPRPLSIAETRRLLIGSVRPLRADPDRVGAGLLDTTRAVAAARCVHDDINRSPTMSDETAVSLVQRAVALLGEDDASETLPDRLFSRLVTDEAMGAPVEVLAFPGDRLVASPQRGDVLLRVAPGEPEAGLVSLLAEGPPRGLFDFAEGNWRAEGGLPGLYAPIETEWPFRRGVSERVARRLADEAGWTPRDQMLVRFLGPDGQSDAVESRDLAEDFPEQTAATPPSIDGRVVNRFARVLPSQLGLALRATPDRSANEVGRRLRFNDRVFVVAELDTPPGWALVTTDDGRTGYLNRTWLKVGPPEPDAVLHKVTAGETAIGVAERYFKNAVAWGKDLRFYVNVLVYVNRDEAGKRRGISKDSDSWKTTKLVEGYYIWVPSVAFADQLRGRVSSGSITYEAWKAFTAFVEQAWEWTKFGVAFVAGLLHGALEAVWDVFVGLADLVGMVWDLLKLLFTGKIITRAQEIWNALSYEAVKEAVGDWIADFDRKWNAKSSLDRGHFRGWVIGYIIAEVLMAFVSLGTVTAVKWGGRLGRFRKLLESTKVLRGVLDDAKDVAGKGGKALDHVKDAYRTAPAPKRDVPRAKRKRRKRGPHRPKVNAEPPTVLYGDTAGTGGVQKITSKRTKGHETEYIIEGVLRESISNKGYVTFRHRYDLPKDIGLPAGSPPYHRAHLWGPGFGDEAADGIMYAPRKLNLKWQNKGIEEWIRDLRTVAARDGGEVKLKAVAKSHPVRTLKSQRELLAQVDYEFSLHRPGKKTEHFRVSVEVDPPPSGRVHSVEARGWESLTPEETPAGEQAENQLPPYATALSVDGTLLACYERAFEGPRGDAFRNAVRDAARRADVNPGLLAVMLLREVNNRETWLGADPVTSYQAGTDHFYSMFLTVPPCPRVAEDGTKTVPPRSPARQRRVQARIPLLADVRWRPEDGVDIHPNELGSDVCTITFASGTDALLAVAAYTAWAQWRLTVKARQESGDFAALRPEVRFALTRYAFNAGTGAAHRRHLRPALRASDGGVEALARRRSAGETCARPAGQGSAWRRATISAAQAIYLSENVFGVDVPGKIE